MGCSFGRPVVRQSNPPINPSKAVSKVPIHNGTNLKSTNHQPKALNVPIQTRTKVMAANRRPKKVNRGHHGKKGDLGNDGVGWIWGGQHPDVNLSSSPNDVTTGGGGGGGYECVGSATGAGVGDVGGAFCGADIGGSSFGGDVVIGNVSCGTDSGIVSCGGDSSGVSYSCG